MARETQKRNTAVTGFSLNTSLDKRLRRFAIARGRSVSSVVAEGVEVLMELYEHDDNRCVSEVNREATQ
jgi:hypothetical protein